MTNEEDAKNKAWATVAADSLGWDGRSMIDSFGWREAWKETVATEIVAMRTKAAEDRQAAMAQLRKQRRLAANRLVRDDWDAERTEESDEEARKEEADQAWMGRRMLRRAAIVVRRNEAEATADAEDVANAAAWGGPLICRWWPTHGIRPRLQQKKKWQRWRGKQIGI